MKLQSVFLTALILTINGVTASHAMAQNIWRGPYLNSVTQNSIIVVWETPTAQTAILRYGINSLNENQVTLPASKHQGHKLTNLLPETEYVYEVEVGGEIRSGHFNTAVNSNSAFAFAVYGDNRSNTVQHEAVVAAVMGDPAPIRFIVSSGDMVSDGHEEDDWDTFFEVEGPMLRSLPIFAAPGNHEDDDGDLGPFERIFEFPEDTPPASGKESYYHVVYGNTQLIFLERYTDDIYRIGDLIPTQQGQWLQDVLDNPPAGVIHRFVVLHEGPYSSKPGRSGNIVLRAWLDAFKEAGIELIISGHDHYAERGWTGNGMIYVINGGGGAPLYETKGVRTELDHTIIYSETRLAYTLVEVDGERVQITTKGLDGEIVDYVAFGDVQNPECNTAVDCGAPPPFACPGSYACENLACAWICNLDAPVSIACVPTVDDCDEIEENCNGGDPECANPSGDLVTWLCQCPAPPPQCTQDSDCTDPPPIEGCTGTWQCVTDVCEFQPDELCGAGNVPDPNDPTDPDESDDDPKNVDPAEGCDCSSGAPPSLWLSLLGAALLGRRSRLMNKLHTI